MTREVWACVRIERWNKDTMTYVAFAEKEMLMQVKKRYLYDEFGRKFSIDTGLCMNRFFPGQKYRYSLKPEVKREPTNQNQ
jgi:hypothetical protein